MAEEAPVEAGRGFRTSGKMKSRAYLGAEEEREVVAAVRAAESRTSAEVRVLITREKVTDPLAEAQAALRELGMRRARARNAVLVYVAPESRKFAVAGDSAAHEKLGAPVWERVAADLGRGFAAGDYKGALVRAVEELGTELARAFPHPSGGENELPDDIVLK